MENGDWQRGQELALQRHDWQLQALDRWRSKQVDPTLASLQRQVDEIVKADEIAEAVAAKMSEGRRIHLSKVQMALGLLSIAAAWASPIILIATGHPG